MNHIYISTTALPVLCGCDFCAAFEPFYHADRTVDFHVMIYVVSGVIYVTEETDGAETDYAVHAGELLFLKNGVHHFGKKECPKGTRWYYVHFCLEGQEKLPVYSVENNKITPYEKIMLSARLPKFLTTLTGSVIEAHIRELTAYLDSDDFMAKWRINSRFSEILSELAFYHINDNKPLTLSDKIADYLQAHCCVPFSAQMLEQHFFLSYKHLAAVFKQEKQLTMQQYHNEIRMNTACKLLRSTLLPIGEISEQTGFSDPLYFSRCFHRFTGFSPTAYRKNVAVNYGVLSCK